MLFSKIATLITPISLVSLAMAGDIRVFNQKDFDVRSGAGRPVVLDINATWCPNCMAQKPIIDALMKQAAYKDSTLMTIDFDTEEATLKRFKVNSQSTLLAFKGAQEVGRSIGDTTPGGLEGLVKETVN